MKTCQPSRLTSTLMIGGVVLALAAAGSVLEAPLQAQIAGCRWDQVERLPIAVYDSAGSVALPDRAIYVHGGIDRDGVVRDDLYRLSLGSYSVERVRTSGARTSRWGHSLTWVESGGRPKLLLIGGNTSLDERFPAEDRVYAFDPSESTWGIAPISGGLPGLQDHGAVYDPASGKIVLHGGCSDNGRAGRCTPQTETFIVDPVNGEVIRGQRDGPRLAGHSMVYDPNGPRLIAFGGTADGNRGSDLTYELRLGGGASESAVWEPLTTTGTLPERRFNHGAVFDTGRNAMIVYGGLKVAGEPLNDTWALDFSTPGLAVWRDLELLNQKRSGMLMAYDPLAHVTLQISGGRPLSPEASKDIFRLQCNAVPTATPTASAAPTQPPVIGPSATPPRTSVPPPPTMPGPGPSATPTVGLGTNVPPPVTVPPGVTPSATPAETALPPPATTAVPSPSLAPPEGGILHLPWLSQSKSAPPATATDGPPPTAGPTQPAPTSRPPGTAPACTSVEREPNDRLLQSLDWPPLCEEQWATGSLVESDPGDYLRVRATTAGRITVRLEDVPAGRDYDLLFYDFAGSLLASSQLPRDLSEELTVDVSVEEYAIRVYPSTGRSNLPYKLRWYYTTP